MRLAEIRVFYKNNFLCCAISQDLEAKTVSLKEIVQARTARRKELRNNIRERTSIIDALLKNPEKISENETMELFPEQQIKTAQVNIRRYRDE